MEIKFDKEQWRMDTDNLRPKEIMEFFRPINKEHSMLSIFLGILYLPIIYLCLVFVSPFIFLNSIKFVKSEVKE